MNVRRLLFTLAFSFSTFCAYSAALAQGTTQLRVDAQPNVIIDLAVVDTGESIKNIEKMLKKAGGKIQKRSRNRDLYDNETATFQAELPTSNFDDMMDQVRSMGTVRRESSNVNPSDQQILVSINVTDRKSNSYDDSRSQGRLFAGVAATNMNLNLSNDKSRNTTGGGITLSPSGRWAQLSIFMLKEAKNGTSAATENGTGEKEPSSAGSSIVLIGHNFYSAIFGGGYRPFLNPFAGLTYGYSRLYNRSLFAIGGTVGLELITMQWFTWSVSSNLMGLYSGRDGGTTSMFSTHLYIPF